MPDSSLAEDLRRRPCSVCEPVQPAVPVVFASPHSGDCYPPEFIALSRLDPLTLRRSEDAYVNELFQGVTEIGAPLLLAHYPRAYVDPNREPFELDPAMFADELPDYVNVGSPRVAAGLGTIAKVVTNGAEIYRGKLRFAEAKARIEALWHPYHRALEGLLEATLRRAGRVLLIDCHSMPSVGGPMDMDPGKRRLDFVLGDRRGTTCAAIVIERVEAELQARGYAVGRNDPYSGGFTTRHYGRPREGRHTLQIEINRALYMEEETLLKRPGFATLARHLTELARAIGDLAEHELPALPGA